MLFAKKPITQTSNEETLSCIFSIINIIENMPSLVKQKEIETITLKNTLHYNMVCKVLLKKLKSKRQMMQVLHPVEILTKAFLVEQKVNICLECSGARSTGSQIVNLLGDFLDLTALTRLAYTLGFYLRENKARSAYYTAEGDLEKLFKDYTEYTKLRKVMQEAQTAVLNEKSTQEEKNYLQRLLKEAEISLGKAEEFLLDEKTSAVIQEEFMKLNEKPLSKMRNSNAVLYGIAGERHFSWIQYTLGSNEKISAYYKLIELAIFSQMFHEEKINFAILIPIDAAKEFVRLQSKEAESSVHELNIAKSFIEAPQCLTLDHMKIAYVLWKANNFTDYETALKAALLTQDNLIN